MPLKPVPNTSNTSHIGTWFHLYLSLFAGVFVFHELISTAAAQGVAGALASASAINYAANKVDAVKFPAKTDCATVADLLSQTPTGFVIGGGAGPACTVTQTDGGGTATWALSK